MAENPTTAASKEPQKNKKTHLEKVDQMPQNYFGMVYYNLVGDVVTDVGNHDKSAFEAKRSTVDKDMRGKWSFAVVKTRDIKGAWKCAIVFPDGDVKELKEGQVATSAPKSRGVWIDYNQIQKVVAQVKYTGPIRFAMDTRIPWKSSAVSMKVQSFENADELSKWLLALDPSRSVLFVANPAPENLPPDEKKYFMLCAVVDA